MKYRLAAFTILSFGAFLLSGIEGASDVYRIITGLYIGFVLIGLVGRKQIQKQTDFTRYYFYWIVYATITSIIFSIDYSQSLNKVITVSLICALIFCISNSPEERNENESMLWIYVLAATGSYIISLTFDFSKISSGYETVVENRIQGTLSNANQFGVAMVQAMFGALLLWRNAKKRGRIILSVILFTLFISVIQSASRTAIIGATICLLCYIAILGMSRTIVLALIIAIAVPYAIESQSQIDYTVALERVKILAETLGIGSGSEVKEDSINERARLAGTAYAMFQENPFGGGLESMSISTGTYAHSNYLELLSATGIVGLVIYYLPFTRILYRSAKKNKWRRNWLIIAFVITQLVMDLFNVSYYSKTLWLMMPLVSGYWMKEEGAR